MATAYYRLRKPFTSVRAESCGAHVKLTLWINHGSAGSLTVRNDELASVLLALASDDVALQISVSSAGGTMFKEDGLSTDTILISEDGELTCLSNIVPDEPRCPKCGYSKKDAQLHGDHHLCSGRIP